jgi:hypothetical protein
MCFQLSKAVFTSRASNGQNRKPSPPIFARRCVQMHSRGQSCDTLTDDLHVNNYSTKRFHYFLLILPLPSMYAYAPMPATARATS